MNSRNTDNRDRNPDPITGAPGSHPVGTGVGAAAGGALAGAAAGSVAGPVGTVAGLAGGAIVGGLAGKGIAESVNPTAEDAYWRENHSNQPYGKSGSYDEYRTAYKTGYEGCARHGGGTFEEHEADLRRTYEAEAGQGARPWSEAREAARAAWHRVEARAERLIGYHVQDRMGHSVGKVDSVWTDDTHQPVFLGIKTGWFGTKNHVVPVHTAKANDARRVIQLPFDEDKMKKAPSFDPDATLGQSDVTTIYRFYGIEGAATSERAAQSAGQSTPREEPPRTERNQPGSQRAWQSDEGRVIPLREEKIKVGKREVEAGGVRIRKIVRTETVTQPVELRREDIVVERMPATGDECAQGMANTPIGEDDIFIPLRREEPVIQKETAVRERVKIGRRSETEQQNVSEQVRKEDIAVEREEHSFVGKAADQGKSCEK